MAAVSAGDDRRSSRLLRSAVEPEQSAGTVNGQVAVGEHRRPGRLRPGERPARMPLRPAVLPPKDTVGGRRDDQRGATVQELRPGPTAKPGAADHLHARPVPPARSTHPASGYVTSSAKPQPGRGRIDEREHTLGKSASPAQISPAGPGPGHPHDRENDQSPGLRQAAAGPWGGTASGRRPGHNDDRRQCPQGRQQPPWADPAAVPDPNRPPHGPPSTPRRHHRAATSAPPADVRKAALRHAPAAAGLEAATAVGPPAAPAADAAPGPGIRDADRDAPSGEP